MRLKEIPLRSEGSEEGKRAKDGTFWNTHKNRMLWNTLELARLVG